MATEGWQLVQCRRRAPPTPSPALPPPSQATPFSAYPSRPSYAQVLRTNQNRHPPIANQPPPPNRSLHTQLPNPRKLNILTAPAAPTATMAPTALPPTAPPPTAPTALPPTAPTAVLRPVAPTATMAPAALPHTVPAAVLPPVAPVPLSNAPRNSNSQRLRSNHSNIRTSRSIVSPDSTTKLRYPPSPSYSEWNNRCFRCFHFGHISSECANPRRCASCWGQGHDFTECRKPHRQAAPIRHDAATSRQARPRPPAPPHIQQHHEADFNDVLQRHGIQTTLPEITERRDRIVPHIFRDSQYFFEVARLSKTLVITQPSDQEAELSLDAVADYVASTGLVSQR